MNKRERVIILKALKRYKPKNQAERQTLKKVRLEMFGYEEQQVQAKKYDKKIERIVNLLLILLTSTLFGISLIILVFKHFA